MIALVEPHLKCELKTLVLAIQRLKLFQKSAAELESIANSTYE
jgi:hypothetical protein